MNKQQPQKQQMFEKWKKTTILFKSLSDKNIAKCANSEIECFAGIWIVEHTKQVTECILYVCVWTTVASYSFFFWMHKIKWRKKTIFCFDDSIVCHSYVITKLWTFFFCLFLLWIQKNLSFVFVLLCNSRLIKNMQIMLTWLLWTVF